MLLVAEVTAPAAFGRRVSHWIGEKQKSVLFGQATALSTATTEKSEEIGTEYVTKSPYPKREERPEEGRWDVKAREIPRNAAGRRDKNMMGVVIYLEHKE